jgi:hypothetical protein
MTWWTHTRISVAGLVAMVPGISLLATGELWLGGAAVATAVFGSSAASLWRLRLDRLPLELSRTGLVGELSGHRVVRFRARLGRGRVLSDPAATVQWLPDDGEPTPIDVVGPGVAHLLGAWTVLAIDRGQHLGEAGTLEVTVRGREGERDWQVSRQFPIGELRHGTFAGGLEHRGGKLSVVPRTWDAVTEE